VEPKAFPATLDERLFPSKARGSFVGLLKRAKIGHRIGDATLFSAVNRIS